MEKKDRPLVIGLASALGLALLIIAFLVGRGSAKPATVTVVSPSAEVTAATSVATLAATPAEAAAPLPTVAIAAPEASDPAPPLAELAPLLSPALPVVTVPPPPTALPHGTVSADQQQVAAYFNQVDRLEEMGGGDPQAFASSLVQSMSSGDFSGFDSLLGKAKTLRQRLQAISPPRACVEHHRLAVTLSAGSVDMLERLKSAMTRGDTAALMTISSDGKTLEAQTNQLKAMAESIKRQAGL